jgi:hypothetical protein
MYGALRAVQSNRSCDRGCDRGWTEDKTRETAVKNICHNSFIDLSKKTKQAD